MSFIEKYRASKFSDIKGQDLVISKIKNFFKHFPEEKAIILHGPAGSGKTSLAYALAHEVEGEIIELNASDLRNKQKLSEIVGTASQQKSLFHKTKVILIDEVDGISGFYDRGGLAELLSLIDMTCFPIIMTANKIWDKKFSSLRNKCLMIELKELKYWTILELLKDIAKKEKKEIKEDLLKNIAINAKGDVRAALNDLETSGTTVSEVNVRDKEESIFNALKQVFKDRPTSNTIGLYDKVAMPLDEIYLWLEENIPNEYKDEDLIKAIDLLSKADVFRGRIYRQQHWRFLVYQNFLLSYGISASKKGIKTGFTSYKRPTRILKIWMVNQRNAIKKEIAKKLARFCHISYKRAMSEFNLLKVIINDENIHNAIGLNEKEIEFLQA